jgi:hypothetical protein
MTLEFKNIEVQGLRFSVKVSQDDIQRPWEWSEGHGPVRPAHGKSKQPHERWLSNNWLYDWNGALKKAKEEGWGARVMPMGLTPNQQLEYVVQQDFDYLRAWCTDDWCYSALEVTLLKDSSYSDSLGGVEYWHYKPNPYADDIAKELAAGLAVDYFLEQSEKAYWESRDVVTV